MNLEDLKKALCIDEKYSFEYLLNVPQEHYPFGTKRVFANIAELFSQVEQRSFKTTSQADPAIQLHNENIISILRKDSKTNAKSTTAIKKEKHELNTIANTKDEKDDNCISSTIVLSKNSSVLYQIEYIKVMLVQFGNEDFINSLNTKLGEYDKFLMPTYRFADLYFPNCENLDRRLNRLPKWFVSSLFSNINSIDSFYQLKRIFGNCIETIISKKAFDIDSLRIVVLYGQLFILCLSIIQKKSIDNDFDYLKQESLAYLASVIAERCFRRDLLQNGLSIAQKSLNIHDSNDRADAFNIMGLLAVDSGDLQLAYDTYQTWIQQKCVGEIDDNIAKTFLKKQEETKWKETTIGKHNNALIYGNLAYVCRRISDTYEFTSEQEKVFYNYSVKYREKAVQISPDSIIRSVSLGKALIGDLNYDMNNAAQMRSHMDKLTKALNLFEEAGKPTKSFNFVHSVASLSSYRNSCQTIMEMMLLETCRTKKDIWKNKNLKEYYEKLMKIAKKYNKFDANSSYKDVDDDLRDELKLRNDLMPILNFFGRKTTTELDKKIHILLIAIRQNTTIMQEYLRRREYISTNYQTRIRGKIYNRNDTRKIAYYTTLKNFSYIFDELYLDKDDKCPKVDKDHQRNDTKNCLTVMNSKYMNDPNEGVVLLNELTRNLDSNALFSGKTANDFTSSIFDENLVFLKSFTEQIDKLTMWNRYANDYDGEGKNSNGCCVFVSPECFVNTKFSKTGRELSDNDWDDYRLYRVVYISPKGEIIKERNKGLHKNVYTLYANLLMLFEQLNSCLNKYSEVHPKDKSNLNRTVEKSLGKSLKKIIFLFKYDDYSDEQESRLILLRDKAHQDDIRLIPGELPMLAINPFFQVFVNGIILGPNVRNAEKWKPYFQYQLNKMWEKSPNNADLDTSKELFFIKYSDIKYLT